VGAAAGERAPASRAAPGGIALLCAVNAERRWLARVCRGGAEPLAGGIGAAAAGRAAERLLADPPEALLSVGFCGALDPGLRVGDLVAAECVVEEASGEVFAADPRLLAAAPGRRGTLVTARNLVRTPADRARLDGLACDLESAAAARVAAGAGIPFLALRAVSDETRHILPDFDRLTDAAGRLRPWAALCHVVIRPWELARLLRLWPASRRAGRALAAGVDDLLARLG
jgi:adenosylhomocysteine nucleosidase